MQYTTQATVDNVPCHIEILDTAGQEEYSAMLAPAISSAGAILLVFSVVDRVSFTDIEKTFLPLVKTNRPGVPMVLVGNKADLNSNREVATSEGQNLARKLGIPFLETSAKTRKKVEDAFYECVREVRHAEARARGTSDTSAASGKSSSSLSSWVRGKLKRSGGSAKGKK